MLGFSGDRTVKMLSTRESRFTGQSHTPKWPHTAEQDTCRCLTSSESLFHDSSIFILLSLLRLSSHPLASCLAPDRSSMIICRMLTLEWLQVPTHHSGRFKFCWSNWGWLMRKWIGFHWAKTGQGSPHGRMSRKPGSRRYLCRNDLAHSVWDVAYGSIGDQGT